MKQSIILLAIFLFPLTFLSAQSEVLGYWTGKMESEYGKYEFKLTVQQQPEKTLRDGTLTRIRAVALHNRQGVNEVIELNGVVFGDNSIYFRDVNNRFEASEGDGKFSRLQFLLKYEKGEPVLDGHWQEYRDVRHYRKGRLLLRKSLGKA